MEHFIQSLHGLKSRENTEHLWSCKYFRFHFNFLDILMCIVLYCIVPISACFVCLHCLYLNVFFFFFSFLCYVGLMLCCHFSIKENQNNVGELKECALKVICFVCPDDSASEQTEEKLLCLMSGAGLRYWQGQPWYIQTRTPYSSCLLLFLSLLICES